MTVLLVLSMTVPVLMAIMGEWYCLCPSLRHHMPVSFSFPLVTPNKNCYLSHIISFISDAYVILVLHESSKYRSHLLCSVLITYPGHLAYHFNDLCPCNHPYSTLLLHHAYYSTVTHTITITVRMRLPAGVNYLHECPLEPNVPIYLLVGGCFGTLKMLWLICQQVGGWYTVNTLYKLRCVTSDGIKYYALWFNSVLF